MLRVLELFGGIGACSKALGRLGVEFEIADYVEIDKYAVKSFNAMHGTNFSPQDIRKWDKDIKVDLIMHGSPCQDFSLAGKNEGGDEGSGTRSSLMYETLRIVEKLKPKYVIWENVRNLLSAKHKHNFDKYLARMQELGYTSRYEVLNAKDYGIPQNRERVFTISIRNDLKQGFAFPPKQELKLKLKDMLQSNVDAKYYLSDKMLSYLKSNTKMQKEKGNGFRFEPTEGDGIAKCIRTKPGQRMDDNYILVRTNTKKGYEVAKAGDSVNLSYPNSKTRRGRVGKDVAQTIDTHCEQGVVEINGDKLTVRRLTPKECWRLMGFDDGDFDKAALYNSDTQLYKQAGNSIVVNVLEAILTPLVLEQTPRDQIPEQLTIFDMFQIENF
jgi:DNA (cytosine-5)-methyltransferase 1